MQKSCVCTYKKNISPLPQVSTFMLELIFIIIMLSSSGGVLQIATTVAQTPSVHKKLSVVLQLMHMFSILFRDCTLKTNTQVVVTFIFANSHKLPIKDGCKARRSRLWERHCHTLLCQSRSCGTAPCAICGTRQSSKPASATNSDCLRFLLLSVQNYLTGVCSHLSQKFGCDIFLHWCYSFWSRIRGLHLHPLF